jgi:hypothetical protein
VGIGTRVLSIAEHDGARASMSRISRLVPGG